MSQLIHILILLQCCVLAAVTQPRALTSAAQPLASADSSTDRLALLSFKSFVTTAAGNALASWNETAQHCSWPGVTCGAPRQPGRVTALSLDSLDLGGTLSPSLGNLTFLQRLELPSNKIRGRIPPELGQLRSLQFLNLSVNSLEGEIPANLGGCSSLQSISLRSNRLQGRIPANLSSCSNLDFISLRNNMFTGTIPPELGSLPKLQMLVLSNNPNITGGIPPSFGNLSSLTDLRLVSCALSGKIPPELGKIAGLQLLDLLFNQFSGNIPPELFNFSDLYGFGLGGNRLTGALPSDFGTNLPSLSFLYLYDNMLEGSVPLSLANATKLETIAFSNNNFTGTVPENLGTIKNLATLQLGGNRLVGASAGGAELGFITSLTRCRNLQELDLSGNGFSGILPDSVSNLSTSLQWLRLRDNKLSGKIPFGIGNLSNLIVLDMENNLLSGPIPDSFGKLRSLQAFSVRNNRLSGEIPHSLGNLTGMLELYLCQNSLSGSIPRSFAALDRLGVLDLSYNNLTGTIPKGVLGISSISTYLNISHNSFTGTLPDEVGSLVNLKALDVSANNFSGRIPPSLGNCLVLDTLNLGRNFFNESIPESLQRLKGIQVLDLSQNRLSGRIPTFLESLPQLQSLNLSFNDLEGEVPTGGVFSSKNRVSVLGNEKLCGGGGNSSLDLKPCSGKKHGRSTITIVVIVTVGVVVLCCSILLFLVMRKLGRRKHGSSKLSRRTSSLKHQFLKISYADLFKATDGFSSANLIGSGGFGLVYRGVLVLDPEADGTEVAVKVLDQRNHAASKSFMTECKALRNIRHRNLIRIVTACSTIDFGGNDFQALIYEYMPNGSLEAWIHEETGENLKKNRFGVYQRLKVAVGVASALDYLHNQNQEAVVHCDMKPSNILLDDDLVAHVGDFGIAKILSTDAVTSTIRIKGSIGYIAPECGTGSPVSTLWDVYSYGILLLEMFTGKRPTDDSFKDGVTLRSYVGASFPEQLMKIIDPNLLVSQELEDGGNSVRDILESVFRIALICSNELPSERMQMRDVVRHLDALGDSFLEQ